jgi:transposase-like protein
MCFNRYRWLALSCRLRLGSRRKRHPKPHAVWHLDEVYLKIDGRMVYLWRAVDAEGEVLDVLVQSKRDKCAALKLLRKLLRKYAVVPERLVTDDLRSYGAATLELGIDHLHDRGRWSRSSEQRAATDASQMRRPLLARAPAIRWLVAKRWRAEASESTQQHAMARSIAVVIARRPALAFSASGKSHIPSEVNLVRRYSV